MTVILLVLLHVLCCWGIWYDCVIELKEEDEKIKREYKNIAISFIIVLSFTFFMLLSMIAGGA